LAKATADRLKILAPFDGSVGIRSINLGDYLKDGADVVNLEDMDAVYVDYRLPERFQTRLRAGQRAEVEVDAVPGRKFSAVVQAIDPLIDANGRSLGVRACIDNRRMQLRPGMFARVATNFSTRDKARVVPEEAIVPQGSRQFVIRLVDSPEGPVTQRVEVKVGMRTPGKVELLDGVAVGDTVVVAGQQRLQRDGTVVRVIEGAGRGGPGGPGGPGGAPGAPGGPGAAAGAAPSGAGPAAGGPGRPPAGRPAANLPPLQGPDPCLVALDGSGRGAARPAGPAASPAAPAAVPARRSGPGPT
jgi:membrane fusion protein (multidrug efflux system)